jgi:hypothetical protein
VHPETASEVGGVQAPLTLWGREPASLSARGSGCRNEPTRSSAVRRVIDTGCNSQRLAQVAVQNSSWKLRSRFHAPVQIWYPRGSRDIRATVPKPLLGPRQRYSPGSPATSADPRRAG